jgi:hypothetical protein
MKLIFSTLATHAGMTTDQFEKIVKDWIAIARHPKTSRLYTEMVYQPMLEVLAYLDKLYAAEEKVLAAANVNAMKLEAFKYYYGPAGATGVAGICAKPTPQILKLQADIIAAAKPFMQETGPIGAFTAGHDDPATDAAMIQYVSTFVPKTAPASPQESTSTRCWPNRSSRSPSRLRARLSISYP